MLSTQGNRSALCAAIIAAQGFVVYTITEKTHLVVTGAWIVYLLFMRYIAKGHDEYQDVYRKTAASRTFAGRGCPTEKEVEHKGANSSDRFDESSQREGGDQKLNYAGYGKQSYQGGAGWRVEAGGTM